MLKKADQPADPPAEPTPPQRHVSSPENIAKARKWFEHARKVAETKNYDYAVELYVNGVALWPEALEEGLRPLRVVAMARKLNGGKPLGFIAEKKYSIGGKDLFANLKNAIYVFGMDPTNSAHMEAILHAAAKARCDRTVQWIAPVLVEALMSEKKSSEKRYFEICKSMEAGADLATAADDPVAATEILQACLRVTQIWGQHHADSPEAQKAYSSASSKQTIVKGRFGAGDFRESLKDADQQSDLRARDAAVQTVHRTKQMIDKARRDWEDNPTVTGKLMALVDLLTRREEDSGENEAISLLEAEFAKTGTYALKSKADDLRMRQTHRKGRELLAAVKAAPQDAAARTALARHLSAQNKIETAVYRERLEQYPTDMRIRFELGKRLFRAKRYDECIPLFQQAQADGRHRAESRLYVGRCLLEKGFTAQAVETLRSAFDEVEVKSSDQGKDLAYWLARALETAGDIEGAKGAYGRLIQIEYNFKDARQRLEALERPGQAEAG